MFRQLQPALFQLLDFAIHIAQQLAGFDDIASGQAGGGQLFFQCVALGVELGQFFIDLFQLFLERLGLVGQLLARGGGQAAATTRRSTPSSRLSIRWVKGRRPTAIISAT